jgi:hypothetical protein
LGMVRTCAHEQQHAPSDDVKDREDKQESPETAVRAYIVSRDKR